MTVAIECKPCTRGPLLSDGPEHGRPIQLVERISCINEQQKSPLFFFFVLPPQLVNDVDDAFDTSFEASAELIDAASLFGIAARDKKSGLCGKPPPGLANSNGAYTGALVKCN
jgi:hypothetical protein